ncbi:hypothetical protein GMMP1_1490001 [Candidatus Magnetomoraceae bacterium gMMP-1]
MIFKLRFKDDGEPVYIYALIEHKSYPEPMVGFQLLVYMVRIWEGVVIEHIKKQEEAKKKREQGFEVQTVPALKKLPAIIPIVLYHGKVKWNVGLNFKSLIDIRPGLEIFRPDFKYILYDLSEYDDDEIKGAVILQVGLLIFKYIFKNELPDRLPEILSLLKNLADKETSLEYLKTIAIYLIKGTDKLSEEDFGRAMESAFNDMHGGGDIMPTLAEKWFKQGQEIGEERGEERGIIETAKKMLKEGLDSDLIKRITGLAEKDLQALRTSGV